jgi:biotin carboxylase
VFASDRCDQLGDPWWDGAIPVRFHLEDAAVAAVTESLDGHPPAAVIAVGDRPVVVAARVARTFGLRWHSPDAAALSRNKLATRRALVGAKLPAPSFQGVTLADSDRDVSSPIAYPVVVKPLQLSGSRGVMRVETEKELSTALGRLRRLLQSPDVRAERDAAHEQAVIESFIPGAEFAVEGVLTAGVLQVLAIFEKPDPLDGPFFEETIYLTPPRCGAATERAIVEQVAAGAAAIGLSHGPVHAECRVNASGVYLLEVAARPIGGLCSRAVKLTDGRGVSSSLEDVLLRHALGEDVTAFRQPQVASGVMMIPIPRRGLYKGTSGEDDALAVDGVEGVKITAKPDTVLVPLPEGRSYLGFIFAGGPTPDAVEHSLREAHRRLRFTIDREILVAAGEVR